MGLGQFRVKAKGCQGAFNIGLGFLAPRGVQGSGPTGTTQVSTIE